MRHVARSLPQSEFYIAPFIIHYVCQENYCGPFNITSRVTNGATNWSWEQVGVATQPWRLVRVSSRQTDLIWC